MRTRTRAVARRAIVTALLVCVYLVAPLRMSAYQLYLLDLACVYVMLAVGLNIVMGVARQFALASAGFFGIGAYTMVLLVVKANWPFAASVVAGTLVASVAAALVSLAAWRVSGLYLAMVTFGFGEIVQFVLVHWDAVTKGPDGLSVPRPVLGTMVLEDERQIFWLYVPIVAAASIAAYRVLSGRLGRTLTALGDSEIALGALGLHGAYYKTVAFALSGAYAGAAGGMFAVLVGFIDPYTFGLSETLLHLTMIAIGGFGSLAGAIVGGIGLTLVSDLLRRVPGLQEIIYGVILLAVFIFCPNGLASLVPWSRHREEAPGGRVS